MDIHFNQGVLIRALDSLYPFNFLLVTMFCFPVLLLAFNEIGVRTEHCVSQNSENSFCVWLRLLFSGNLNIWDHETFWVLNSGNTNWPQLLMFWPLWFPLSVDSKNGFPVVLLLLTAHSNGVGNTSPTGMMSLSCVLWKTVFWSSERSKHSAEAWWQFNGLVIVTWADLHSHENIYPLWLDTAPKILFQLWSIFSFSVLMFQNIYSGTIYSIFSLCVRQAF